MLSGVNRSRHANEDDEAALEDSSVSWPIRGLMVDDNRELVSYVSDRKRRRLRIAVTGWHTSTHAMQVGPGQNETDRSDARVSGERVRSVERLINHVGMRRTEAFWPRWEVSEQPTR